MVLKKIVNVLKTYNCLKTQKELKQIQNSIFKERLIKELKTNATKTEIAKRLNTTRQHINRFIKKHKIML